ncbi:putative metalloprotease CJM1_0395 family protein [Desulfovibrio porci]|uniref:putative metalloprotease CJM1_0395 family protein n=1 Tax=Desulfovibrio porci TaxID=2605782 RepID=UPI002A818FA3|nr:putative metalloprotease CJM1_0395 family protein [Desulfovibrio porci]MDY3809498.1 putative metalloprotease CJM1_0395 family protein [Desulfovibrio porci]
MPEALESISARPVGPLAPSASVAGSGGAAKDERGRESGAFSLPGRADQNGDGSRLSGAALTDSLSLSPEAQQQLRELKQRDAEVRAHEGAHMAAGGAHVTGGADYTYQKGPDGRQYAIGGHVSIDASSVPGDPEATKEKAQQVRRAALAPGEPSGQDRQVAARAAAQEARAERDKRKEEAEESRSAAASGGVPDAPVSAGAESLAAAAPADGVDPGAPDAPTESIAAAASAGASPLNGPAELLTRRRAAGAYADMSMRGVMPTALAPGGTGISLQV